MSLFLKNAGAFLPYFTKYSIKLLNTKILWRSWFDFIDLILLIYKIINYELSIRF